MLKDDRSNSASSTLRRRPFAALVLGFVTTMLTYGSALAFAAAQLHTAVVILAWPTFVLVRLLPPGPPVTSGSPQTPWLMPGSVVVAWLMYSTLWYFWLGRRRYTAVA